MLPIIYPYSMVIFIQLIQWKCWCTHYEALFPQKVGKWGWLSIALSLFFPLCIDNNTRKQKSSEKRGRPITWGIYQVDIGRAGPNKHSQAELSTSRVSANLLSSSEALKRNRLDDELTEDRLNRLQAPPLPTVHLVPTWHITWWIPLGLSRFLPLFYFCVLSWTKLKSKKRGRPGNVAKLPICQETREGNDWACYITAHVTSIGDKAGLWTQIKPCILVKQRQSKCQYIYPQKQ